MTKCVEKWQACFGFEDQYEVSTHGGIRFKGTHLPKATRLHKGYVEVSIGRRSLRLHRLIAGTFIPGALEAPMIRHLDDDKRNNRIDNLAPGTHAENMEDAKRNGVLPRGSARRFSKLQEYEVRFIKAALAAGLSKHRLSTLFLVDRKTIRNIAHGRKWTHV